MSSSMTAISCRIISYTGDKSQKLIDSFSQTDLGAFPLSWTSDICIKVDK